MRRTHRRRPRASSSSVGSPAAASRSSTRSTTAPPSEGRGVERIRAPRTSVSSGVDLVTRYERRSASNSGRSSPTDAARSSRTRSSVGEVRRHDARRVAVDTPPAPREGGRLRECRGRHAARRGRIPPEQPRRPAAPDRPNPRLRSADVLPRDPRAIRAPQPTRGRRGTPASPSRRSRRGPPPSPRAAQRRGEEAVEHRRLAVCLVHEEEAAARGSGQWSFRDESRERRGKRRVDRIAAVSQDPCARFCGQRVAGCDCATHFGRVLRVRQRGWGRMRRRVGRRVESEAVPVLYGLKSNWQLGSETVTKTSSPRTQAVPSVGECRRARVATTVTAHLPGRARVDGSSEDDVRLVRRGLPDDLGTSATSTSEDRRRRRSSRIRAR